MLWEFPGPADSRTWRFLSSQHTHSQTPPTQPHTRAARDGAMSPGITLPKILLPLLALRPPYTLVSPFASYGICSSQFLLHTLLFILFNACTKTHPIPPASGSKTWGSCGHHWFSSNWNLYLYQWTHYRYNLPA